MKQIISKKPRTLAFTLIELVLVIAIIGILSLIAVTILRRAADDARRVIARQQQASLHSAMMSWLSEGMSIRTAKPSGNDTLTVEDCYPTRPSVSAMRNLYESFDQPKRLECVMSYMSDDSNSRVSSDNQQSTSGDALYAANGDKITTPQMVTLGSYLQFSSWTSLDDYPKVLYSGD